jgi:hypothetical protein
MREREYFSFVKNYRFIFCSEGNGYENHRIWETLYQGSFPVMLKTDWSKSLEWLNLPILLIDNFGELTKDKLYEFEKFHQDFHPHEKAELWIPFWRDLIARNIE